MSQPLDFELDGKVTTAGGNAEQTIRDQMPFTIGQLNGQTAVGRLDKLELSKIERRRDGDLTRITYHAKLPVSRRRRASGARTTGQSRAAAPSTTPT